MNRSSSHLQTVVGRRQMLDAELQMLSGDIEQVSKEWYGGFAWTPGVMCD